MLALYVSGHGYGHATREAAIAAALKELRPDLPVEVRTMAPAWIFTEQAPGLSVSRGGPDPGMTQRDALDVDLPGSLKAHLELGAAWDKLVAAEAGWLKERKARLVAADVTPLAFAAAEKAGVPSVAVSNFTWDWILDEYVRGSPAWKPVVDRYARAYSRARLALRLPMHGEFPAFKEVIDVPLVSRMGRGKKTTKRPMVLVAFGGFGVELNFGDGDDLSAFEICGFGPKPKGLRSEWRQLRSGTSRDQLEAMAACDVVLCKPGYGMFSEAMAHGKRVVYVPRTGFREIGPLVKAMEERGACAALGREDFLQGRWKRGLETVLDLGAPPPAPADGAAVVARALWAMAS